MTTEELRQWKALLRLDPFHGMEQGSLEQQELLCRGVVAVLEEVVAQASGSGSGGWPVPPDPDSPLMLLEWAAAGHPFLPVRGQALQALLRLAGDNQPGVVDAVYRLAVEDDLPAARQAIVARGWQPERATLSALFDWFTLLQAGAAFPEEKLSLLTDAYFHDASPALQRRLISTAPANHAERWAQFVQALQEDSIQALMEFVGNYPSYRKAERTLALDWLSRAAKSGSVAAQETIPLLFIRHEDPQARELALANNYLPEDSAGRALFFFLASAWEQYQSLDFDHRLLISAYEESGRALRRRMLEHARHTGQMEWLRTAGSAGEVRWIQDMTDADWQQSIQRLSEQERNPELWQLAQVAPPVWSAQILHGLAQSGWLPAGTGDQEHFTTLSRLAADCTSAPVRVRAKKTIHAPGELSVLALSSAGLLAGGGADQRIYLWNLPDGTPQPSLNSPAAVTRALAFSPDGEHVAAASGDHRIRVFRPRSGQMVKTLEGPRAMIRSLAVSPDGRLMYSAGFDGHVRTWRFPIGPQLQFVQPGRGEIFSMVMAGEGRYLVTGGADGMVHVLGLPEVVEVRAISAHADTITHLASFPSSELVISAGRDNALRAWNITSGGLLRTIPYGGAALTSLCLHPNEQVVIGGRMDGEITLWSLSTGHVIDRITGHAQAVNSLVIGQNGDILYSCAADGAVMVWDLFTFLAVRLPGDPDQPGTTARYSEWAGKPGLPSAEKKWLTFTAELARWRQRFDIELSELAPIQAGEFDIELM